MCFVRVCMWFVRLDGLEIADRGSNLKWKERKKNSYLQTESGLIQTKSDCERVHLSPCILFSITKLGELYIIYLISFGFQLWINKIIINKQKKLTKCAINNNKIKSYKIISFNTRALSS